MADTHYRITILITFEVFLLICQQSGVRTAVCPAPCFCIFDDIVSGNSANCSVSPNTTVHLSWLKSHKTKYRPELTIRCVDTDDFTCFDFPQFDITHYRMKVQSCPTELLECVNGNFRQPTATIEKLETIKLYGNYTEKDFKGLTGITDLTINLRDRDPLPVLAIKSMPRNYEVSVTIDGGDVELPPNVFEGAQLKEMALLNNNITYLLPDSFSGLSLTKLKIQGNTFERINAGSFKGVQYIEEINLELNKLKYIEAGAFASESIKLLLLQNNYIENLPNGFLNGMDNLQRVQILTNKVDVMLDNRVFSNLPSSVDFIELYKFKLLYITDALFSKSYSIKTLKMHETKLTELPNKIFSDLTSLNILSLSGNKLRFVTKTLFSSLTNLKTLNLNNNQVTTLADNQFSFSPHLKEILLSDNKITILNLTSFVGTDLEILNLFGNGIRSVNGDAATVWTNLNTLKLGGNKLKSFEHIVYGLKKLTYADFSRNEIRTIQENKTYFFSSKVELDLRRNQISNVIRDLSVVPEYSNNEKIILYLTNNNFKCDCSLTTVIHEWNKAGLLKRFEDITCSDGQFLSEITPFVLCNKNHTLIAMIGTSIVGTLILILLLISIIANWRKLWTYMLDALKRDDSRCMIEMEMAPPDQKLYDVFISFAHKDETFVTDELLPKLEGEFGLKACVHYRDWIVGELITDQIQESVENSKMTVIILTENFLMSEWSSLEFRTAYNLSIEDGRQRVIVILLDESISRDDKLSSDLKNYISLNTYLLWQDNKFWDKLKKVLPKSDIKSDKLKASK